jgi:hypothetical protein
MKIDKWSFPFSKILKNKRDLKKADDAFKVK